MNEGVEEMEDSQPCHVCGNAVNDDDYHSYGYCGRCSEDLRKFLKGGGLTLTEGGIIDYILDRCSPETVRDLIRVGKDRVRKRLEDMSIPEGWPQFVRIGEGGTCMRKGVTTEQFGGWGGDPTWKITQHYWRDAGAWGLLAKVEVGKLVVDGKGATKHLDGEELVACTQEEWEEDNDGYLPRQRAAGTAKW